MSDTVEKPAEITPVPEKNNGRNLKLAIMYVLIGGLVLSALISVVAILIGEFNEIIQKTLFTTFIVVTHTLLLLGFISSDKCSLLGRSIIPTTIFAVVLANIVTSTLGTWGVWDAEISARAFSLYALLVGTAFIAAGLLKARIAQPLVTNAIYVSLGLLGLWTLLLVPWIFIDLSMLDEFYFRLIGAASILLSTAVAVTIVLRQIFVSQKPELKTVQPDQHINGGMLAIIITVGVIVSIMWFVGFFAFLVSAAQASF